MAPLGNAMGFVNGKEGDGALAKPFQTIARQQPFRGEVKQIKFTGPKGPPGGKRLPLALARVERSCPNA